MVLYPSTTTMGFYFANNYYGYPIGTKVRGSIGNKYTYQLSHNKQVKYLYRKPANPQTIPQQTHRNKLKQAVMSWQGLPEAQKDHYRNLEPFIPIMSGYNYYISHYIKNLI